MVLFIPFYPYLLEGKRKKAISSGSRTERRKEHVHRQKREQSECIYSHFHPFDHSRLLISLLVRDSQIQYFLEIINTGDM
jgi:hypothetical protein